MRGLGRASGAITIVNALLNGSGAAAAVDLPSEAAVEVHRTTPGEVTRFEIDPRSDSYLVREVVAAGLRAYAPDGQYHVGVSIRSEVPRGCGLKSSSAASVAVLEGLARALGRQVEPVDFARLAADTAQRVGQSATGAFDDALAAIAGGVVVTDNRTRTPVSEGELPDDVRCILWIPRGQTHPSSTELVRRFGGLEAEGTRAIADAVAGKYPSAMDRNSRAVEPRLGLDHRALRAELRRRGALGASVSGMGPSLAVLAPAGVSHEIAEAFPDDLGEARIVTSRRSGELPRMVREEALR